MRYLSLPKEDLTKFVNRLRQKYAVMAPTAKENQFVFARIDEASELCLDYNQTILPPKKYFFPQNQTIGTFTLGECSMMKTQVEIEPTVLFGVHTCDIEGIQCMNIVFKDDPADPYFEAKKKSILIVGYECMKPCDECAICVSMNTHNPTSGYDIMITDAGEKYILHVNSRAGDALIRGFSVCKENKRKPDLKSELLTLREKKMSRFDIHLKLRHKKLYDIFEQSYNSAIWHDVGKRCVSCGNCTAVCPTCYCFNIQDSLKLDMSGGNRNRTWDSCQLDEFAAIAGGINFRKERASRQRHRYYRKFNYSIKKNNKYFCVGCGRCTRTCMADISLIETVNGLAKESGNGR